MNNEHIDSAIKILNALELPNAQLNQRSGICLLALLNLTPDKDWHQSENPLIGITPMMEFCGNFYNKKYAPNSRETFRRESIHQFLNANIILSNPDDPIRPVNSPKTVYQIVPEVLILIKTYRKIEWEDNLKNYLSKHESLRKKYAKVRELNKVPILLKSKRKIYFSAGEHSKLIKAIIEDFAPQHAPGSSLVYAGDTRKKEIYFDKYLFESLNINLDPHGKMPDVIIHYTLKNWLILVEAVTSHGPVDNKRHEELKILFSNSKAGLVYVTAFQSRSLMTKYLNRIAWESEVWVADEPTHLIHFNGIRFLGPYKN